MDGRLVLTGIGRGRCPLLGSCLYVWVQGCPRRCPGCCNTDAQAVDTGGFQATVPEVAALWRKGRGDLVLSGGEPLEQAGPLARLCAALRAEREAIRILLYTGYRIEEVITAGRRDWVALLSAVDVVVDGPYLRHRKTDMPLAGSDNQRLFLMSGRVSPADVARLRAPCVSVSLGAGGKVRVVGTGGARHGFPDPLEKLLQESLEVSWHEGPDVLCDATRTG